MFAGALVAAPVGRRVSVARPVSRACATTVVNMHRTVSLAVFAAPLLACVHIAPQELVDARVGFGRTAEGPARTYSPVELAVAGDALELAQEMFQAHGDTAVVRDQANTALRMAELVDTWALIARRIAEQQRRQAGAGP